ncbi:MAG: cohesin domain-containing protein [Blastocatellia bacterium]
MRCETVVSDFQNVLLQKIEVLELSKDLSIHLQNCNYCQKDCQKLIADYTNQPNNNKEISQTAFAVLKPPKINTFNQFTLLNYDPFLVKFFKEIEKATLDFIDNPSGFIREVIDPVFERQNSPYWDKSVRLATLIWLSSCVSIVLYGGFGWWWFPSNNVNSKDNELLTDSQKIYYISASLPYPPTYWTRNPNKIDSNKTTSAINKSLATKTASNSKGLSPQPTNLEANLSTKSNSSIGSTKTTTPEVRSNAFFASELKSSTNSSNFGIEKETKGNFVTGGRFVNSNTAQISIAAAEDDEDNDEECCDANNMCAEHKAMAEKNSAALQFGISSSSNEVGAINPNAAGGNQIRAFVTPNTVSGGGMFSANTTPNINNSTTEKSKAVEVEARSIPPIIKAGRLGYLSIILKPYVENPLLTNFTATLQFNSSLVKINKVNDGGLMGFYGVNPDFNYNISKNSVRINISCPANTKAVKAFGQLILIHFEAIAPGFADFTLTDVQLLSVNGETLPITLVNSQTEVVGN